MGIFSRSEMIIGEKAQEKLASSSVAIFGLGGVGSYIAEALCRAGIGRLGLYDGDVIDESNINRQLFALHSTVGMDKSEVAKKRLLDINPEAAIEARKIFFEKSNCDEIDFSSFDYIVDAIDTVSSKLLIIETAYKNNIKVISSMGTGNKIDPSRFEIADIFFTSVCPLARVMRKELKARSIASLKVCYSREEPHRSACDTADRRTPGSLSFVPGSAGLLIASEVVKDLIITYIP